MTGGARQRWSIPNALKVLALAIGAVVLVLFFWKARSLFLTLFLAVIFGLALAKPTDWLERHRVRRSLGAPFLMLIVLGALVGVFALIAPRLREQMRDLTKELPKAIHTIERKLGGGSGSLTTALSPGGQTAEQRGGAPQQRQSAQPSPAKPQGGQPAQSPQTQQQHPRQQQQQQQSGVLQQMINRELRGLGRILFPVISSTFEALAGLLIVIFVSIYIAVSPSTYRDGILHLVPHKHRARGKEVLHQLDVTLREWLVARLIAVVVIGVITAAGLALLRVKAALALGVIAGLLEFIPFFGPIISAIPALGIALVESPQKAFYVVLLYIVIQQIEGNLLTPLLLKERLEIPPVLTIAAVSAFGIVFGVVGMLAAEPLLVVLMVLIKMLYVQDVVGDSVPVGDEKD